jgi:predicted XRE-type DNA-binding protein
MPKTRSTKKERVPRSSGNIFSDLFPDADDLDLIRLQAAFLIGKAINKHGLSQRAAAVKLGIAQPDVSRILNGECLDRFSLERLLTLLRALGNDVEIKIRSTKARRGRFLMTA